MPVHLDTSSADFAKAFGAFLAMKREAAADVEAACRRIVDDVAARGDAALLEATRKFDRLDIDAARLRVRSKRVRIGRVCWHIETRCPPVLWPHWTVCVNELEADDRKNSCQ